MNSRLSRCIDPHPDWVTKSAFARLLGVSPGRVSQLTERGLPVEIDDRIDPARGVAWCRLNLDRRSSRADLAGSRFDWRNLEGDVVDEAARHVIEGVGMVPRRNQLLTPIKGAP